MSFKRIWAYRLLLVGGVINVIIGLALMYLFPILLLNELKNLQFLEERT